MGIFCPPQPRLGDGARLDDRIGYRFAALLPPDFAASLPAETLERLADCDVTVVVDDAPELRAWLKQLTLRPFWYARTATCSARPARCRS
jgi:hypothetical protein